MVGDPTTKVLIASDAGYGFITKLEELYTKNRSGKTILSLSQTAKALTPILITNLENQYLAAITNVGRMLIFPLAWLPILNRGKGNKIIEIPTKLAATREEYLAHLVVLNKSDRLILTSGKRSLTLNFNDLAEYQGQRGRRGNTLPRGLKEIDIAKTTPCVN